MDECGRKGKKNRQEALMPTQHGALADWLVEPSTNYSVVISQQRSVVVSGNA